MNSDKYIVLQQWMVMELQLKGSELITFALIHGITIHESDFFGTAKYLSSWLGINEKRCYGVLASLCEKGYIKRVESNDGRNHYVSIIGLQNVTPEKDGSQNVTLRVAKCNSDGCKTLPNNIDNNIDNNIENIYKGEGENLNLFGEVEPKKERKRKDTSENLCKFVNSKFYDIDLFCKEFDKPEFNGIDIVYYYHSLADWASSKGVRRNDWISTARNFIRSDIEHGKLHKTRVLGGLTQEQIDYLKMLDE